MSLSIIFHQARTDATGSPAAPPKPSPFARQGSKGWGALKSSFVEATKPEEKDAEDLMADFLDDEDEFGGKKKTKKWTAGAAGQQDETGASKGDLKVGGGYEWWNFVG